MKKTYQITEFSSFISGKEVDGYISLPESTFAQLENFILSNTNGETDGLDLMSLSARKRVGKVITAKNYVGIISMKDGTTIEILPKIYSKEDFTARQVKTLFIDMLRSLQNSPFKSLQSTAVDTSKMNIFEIFIRMFLDEVYVIVKKGLKNDYNALSENGGVVKGKILFSEQIKHNYAHKERIYIEYDDFNTNRPENKLIKATLLYLYRQTTSNLNKKDLRTLLNAFGEVKPSTDYSSDFERCKSDRNMTDYSTTLMWCKVFLAGKSFTAFSGSEIAFALLFPMETLFESYVAVQMRKSLNPFDYKISVQDKKYHLFDYPNRKFLMKPDIVVQRKSDKAIFICDTKWKVLAKDKTNYGISQADMYQMYAYQKKYNAKNVTLIYPRTEKMRNQELNFQSNDGVVVQTCFVDLFDMKKSLSEIERGFS